MNIYSIGMYENPTVESLSQLKVVEFAHFSVVGTWAYRREPCKTCQYYWQEIVPPLLIQWEPSTERIGDFSWDGPFGERFIVRKHVSELLQSFQFGCNFSQVEVAKSKRTKNTVPFPYKGPELLWGQCQVTVDLDMKASGVKVESSCPDCGDVRYTLRKSGIVIRRSQWNRQHMFRISSNGPAIVFVTENGRQMLQTAGLTNVAFAEAGVIDD